MDISLPFTYLLLGCIQQLVIHWSEPKEKHFHSFFGRDNNSQINVKRACDTADVLINLMLVLREIIVSHTNISAQNKKRGKYGSTCGF